MYHNFEFPNAFGTNVYGNMFQKFSEFSEPQISENLKINKFRNLTCCHYFREFSNKKIEIGIGLSGNFAWKSLEILQEKSINCMSNEVLKKHPLPTYSYRNSLHSPLATVRLEPQA